MNHFKNSDYHNAITEEIDKLALLSNTIFIGQLINTNTGNFYGLLRNVPQNKRKEVGVCEELQMGMSIGMSLDGYLPISIYQRMDFLPRAADQIINHLDLIKELSNNYFSPKVIIFTTIGNSLGLDVGLQHNKNLIGGFQILLRNIQIYELNSVEDVHTYFNLSTNNTESSILIAHQKLF